MKNVIDKEAAARRLRAARARAGFETAKAAIEQHGWNQSTYDAHENGQNGYFKSVLEYASAFRTTPGHLLFGDPISINNNDNKLDKQWVEHVLLALIGILRDNLSENAVRLLTEITIGLLEQPKVVPGDAVSHIREHILTRFGSRSLS